jgi:hypothetical protein
MLLLAAEQHGNEGGIEAHLGDVETFFRVAFGLLTPDQLVKFWADNQVRETVQEIPEYEAVAALVNQPPGTDGPGDYKIAVYYDDEGVRHHAGTWEEHAESLELARLAALDEFEDDRIQGWSTDILATPDENRVEGTWDGEYLHGSLEGCVSAGDHLKSVDEDGCCSTCGYW